MLPLLCICHLLWSSRRLTDCTICIRGLHRFRMTSHCKMPCECLLSAPPNLDFCAFCNDAFTDLVHSFPHLSVPTPRTLQLWEPNGLIFEKRRNQNLSKASERISIMVTVGEFGTVGESLDYLDCLLCPCWWLLSRGTSQPEGCAPITQKIVLDAHAFCALDTHAKIWRLTLTQNCA